MVTTTQPTIQRAESVVADEIDIVAAERDAFERLLARLDRLDATAETATLAAPEAGGGSLLARSSTTTAATAGMASVRSAYRETVMAVPHYDREYGDSIPESLRSEFGDRLAGAVVEDGPLTPVVRRALVDAVRKALSRRTQFLDALRRERQSLDAAESDLDAIESRTVELSGCETPDARSELDRLESRCAAVVADRQELVHGRSPCALSDAEADGLLAYLYGDLGVRCPVLSDAAACLRTIEAVRGE